MRRIDPKKKGAKGLKSDESRIYRVIAMAMSM